MANVKLEWTQENFAESFNIYRSDEPMDLLNMPVAIATGIVDLYYFDESIVIDNSYFYRVGAVRGGNEMISSEVEVLAGAPVVSDPFWSDVELLIFADAISFPSTTFVDSSTKSRVVVTEGTPTIVDSSVTTPKFDAGSIYLEGSEGSPDSIGATINIGTSDYTFECFVKIPTSPNSPWYARLFDVPPIIVLTEGTTYNQMYVDVGGSAKPSFTTGIPNGTWFHACLMRKSGVLYFFIDGVEKWSGPSTHSINNYARIGGGGVNNRSFNAYINSVRMTKAARYSEAGFAPPDAKFPKL